MCFDAVRKGTILDLCQTDMQRLFVSHSFGRIGNVGFGFVLSARVADVDVVIKR